MTTPRSIAVVLMVTAAATIGLIGSEPPLLATGADQQSALDQPFKGVTTDGSLGTGLFPIIVTGVSTSPVRAAAARFLDGLTGEQEAATRFPVDDLEWRRWANVHRASRQGISFEEMNSAQREAAIALLRASLSAEGLEESRNIMRLNGHLTELLPERAGEYGEGKYWITVMGEPSPTEPWGWQLDGHHLVINYFVLGDQVVMTPTFMGSEPVTAESGPLAGTTVLRDEQDLGLAFMQSLPQNRQAAARAASPKSRGNAQAQQYQDNLVLPYEGLRAAELGPADRERLLAVIGEYVGNMPEGHAAVKMAEVAAHLDDTWFYWVGEVTDDAVFYYRIHSPVILIEFDHQGPIALGGARSVATRAHVHTVVRTPNGNDYGKDLLRQHYETHRNDPAHGHAHDAPGRKGR